jgi:hypothetical protein
MDNSMDKDRSKTRTPPQDPIANVEYPPEYAYTFSIGPIEPDRGSTKLPVTVPLVIVLDGKRYIAGHITFGADGQLAEAGLIRPLSQESLRYIRRHAGGGFAIGNMQITSGLYTEEPPYSRVQGSRIRTPVQDYKGDFEPAGPDYKGYIGPEEEDYRTIPYALRKGFSGESTFPEITGINPYPNGSVNWLRHSVDMEPVTDEQIAEVMKTFPSADAWNSMIFDLQIAQPPVIVSAMNRMFPPQPE